MKQRKKTPKVTRKSPTKNKVVGRRTKRKVVKPKLLKAINMIGKAAEVARKIPVSQTYISHMLYNEDVGVSELVANRIEELTNGKVKAKELRPKQAKAKVKSGKAASKVKK